MDPNETLKRLLEEARQGIRFARPDAMTIAELVEALDGWIRKGGFLPTDWERKLTLSVLATGLPQALVEVKGQRDAAVTLLRKFMSATGNGALDSVRSQAAELLGE